MDLEPLGKIGPREEYGFALWVIYSDDKIIRIRVDQKRPVDYHQGIRELIDKYKEIQENYENVRIPEESDFDE